MSSGSKCSKNGCTFFASKSGFCSQHDPAGEAERTQRREQDREQKIRFQAKEKRRLEEAREWWNAMRPRDSNSPKRYLLLGATPHEERRGRTHYNRPNVFLLGHDLPNRKGVNYRRYIEADYSSENADRLREIALNYEDQFDEISFDWSTMCAFFGGDNLDQISIFLYDVKR
jgi:hypothetical protein